jgi:MATE family multidrug resistance protein
LIQEAALESRLKTWYSQPSGIGEVLRVALPLMVSTASMTIMQFTDRMFLLWESQADMAGAMSAGVLSFAVAVFPFGIAAYVAAFVGQYYGAERHHRIGLVTWQAIFFCLACTPFVLATNVFAPQFFAAVQPDPDIVAAEIVYYRIMNFGAAAVLISTALAGYFSGRGSTRVVMIVDCAAAALNIALDYAWIFGHWGFPAWGVAGAAWATIVSQWAKVFVYFCLFLAPQARARFGTLSGCRIDWALMRRLVYYAAPTGLQLLIEVGGFTVLLFLVGQLREVDIAATSLALNINTLAFMPVWGISMATTALVGQRLGENRPDLAARASWSSIVIGSIYMVAFSAIYVLLPDVLLLPHQPQPITEEFIELRSLTIVLLRFVAVYCLCDALYIIFSGTLKGAGDTRFIMYASGILAVAAVGATWLGINYAGFGVLACWVVITTWVLLLGVVFAVRFLDGKWRDMRVIEPEDEEEPLETNLEMAADCTG